jgi:hypothetical protein
MSIGPERIARTPTPVAPVDKTSDRRRAESDPRTQDQQFGRSIPKAHDRTKVARTAQRFQGLSSRFCNPQAKLIPALLWQRQKYATKTNRLAAK